MDQTSYRFSLAKGHGLSSSKLVNFRPRKKCKESSKYEEVIVFFEMADKVVALVGDMTFYSFLEKMSDKIFGISWQKLRSKMFFFKK